MLRRLLAAVAPSLRIAPRPQRIMPFYAVHKGRKTGVFDTWKECQEQIQDFKGARFKKFDEKSLAEQFVVTGKKPAEEGTASEKPGKLAKDPASRKRKHDRKCQLCRLASCSDPWLHCSTAAAVSATCPECDGELVEVYTDGSCEGNGNTGATGGIGVYWGEDHANNLAEPLHGRQTNNRAETIAVCRVLEQCHEQSIKCIRIWTDSNFLIQAMTEWWDGWKKRGWKKSDGGEIKNLEEFQRLDKLREGLHVDFRHVPGHSGIAGNEAADRLSRAGAAKTRALHDEDSNNNNKSPSPPSPKKKAKK